MVGGVEITKQSFIDLLDARWEFGGVREVEKLYEQKRNEALKGGNIDYDLYKEYVEFFEDALLSLLENNLSHLLDLKQLSSDVIDRAQDVYFKDEDFSHLLNQKEYLNLQIPEWLNEFEIDRIYTNINQFM